MKVLGIISALAFAPTVQSSFGILYRTNTVRTKKLVNCIFLGCCKLNVSLYKGYGNGLRDDTGLGGGGTDVRRGGGVVRRWGVGVRGCMQTCGPGQPTALTVSEDGPLHPRL